MTEHYTGLIGFTDSRQLNYEESSSFIHLNMAGAVGQKEIFDKCLDVDSGLRILYSRTRMFGCPEPDPGLCVFLAILSNGRPGTLVMWAYTMAYHFATTGAVLTIETASFGLIAMGVPTEEAYRKAWDAQKHLDGAPGNWLDSKQCGEFLTSLREAQGAKDPATPPQTPPPEEVPGEAVSEPSDSGS